MIRQKLVTSMSAINFFCFSGLPCREISSLYKCTFPLCFQVHQPLGSQYECVAECPWHLWFGKSPSISNWTAGTLLHRVCLSSWKRFDQSYEAQYCGCLGYFLGLFMNKVSNSREPSGEESKYLLWFLTQLTNINCPSATCAQLLPKPKFPETGGHSTMLLIMEHQNDSCLDITIKVFCVV